MKETAEHAASTSQTSNKPKGVVGRFLRQYVCSLPRKICCVLLVLGALVAVLYLLVTNDGLYRSSGLKVKKEALEADNLRLEEENRQLMARIERFGQDPVYLEDEARRKLRLVRPGETIYRLAEEPDLSDNEAAGQLD
ncbi:MAG: septum formation initiator family protein [Deltaproteobacteria bacterium]|jgi:cell division protein FtsB|nr:septum formation initiator family protein [Deltaproteobacteria bacterium]